MQVLYSDGQLMRWGGRLHLTMLGGSWCVTGPGYLCAVATVEEGRFLMAELKAQGRTYGVAIEYQDEADPGDSPTPLAGPAFA